MEICCVTKNKNILMQNLSQQLYFTLLYSIYSFKIIFSQLINPFSFYLTNWKWDISLNEVSPFIHSSDLVWNSYAVTQSCSKGCLFAIISCSRGNWVFCRWSKSSSLLIAFKERKTREKIILLPSYIPTAVQTFK